MKKLNLILSLIFAIVLFSSCSNDEKGDVQKNIEMTIYSDTGFSGYLFSDNFFGEYLLYSEGNDKNQKVLANGFEGFSDFEYEKGYEYKIKVRKTTLANPPQDGSSVVYNYLETISKKKVVIENSEQEIEIEVGPKKVDFRPRSQEEIQKAFLIKENVVQNSKVIIAIDNFDHEEGNRYRLKVKKVIQAEPYAVKYILIEVLSKVKA